MANTAEVVRAEWLSKHKKVILVSLIDNCERRRVECEEWQVDDVAEFLWADLQKATCVTSRQPVVRAHLRLISREQAG